MGNMKIDVEKALETIAERKKGAVLVRERVLHDLAAVYNDGMTIREAVEFGFAMADSDPDVAEHIGTITLGEVLGLAHRQAPLPGPKGRAPLSALDGRVVSETVEAIRGVLKEA